MFSLRKPILLIFENLTWSQDHISIWKQCQAWMIKTWIFPDSTSGKKIIILKVFYANHSQKIPNFSHSHDQAVHCNTYVNKATVNSDAQKGYHNELYKYSPLSHQVKTQSCNPYNNSEHDQCARQTLFVFSMYLRQFSRTVEFFLLSDTAFPSPPAMLSVTSLASSWTHCFQSPPFLARQHHLFQVRIYLNMLGKNITIHVDCLANRPSR